MSSAPGTRERLIAEGMKQLIALGYEGVGIGPVLAAVQVPKGSFYYFFKSKDAFVLAVMQAYAQQYQDLRAEVFANEALSPLARLEAYFEALEQALHAQLPGAGCLYGAIAQTATERVPAIRELLRAVYQEWEDSLRGMLGEAQRVGELEVGLNIADAARHLIDAYEGTLVRIKATGDVAAFGRLRAEVVPRLLGLKVPVHRHS